MIFALNYEIIKNIFVIFFNLLIFQEKLFHFWFNTFFVRDPAVIENGNKDHKHCGQHEKTVRTNSMDDSTNLRFPNNKSRLVYYLSYKNI